MGLFGSIGNALGGDNVLGSIISGAWDNINMNSANAKAKRQAEWQNNRNVYNYQHQIQWAVDDAKKAGINPAVAVNTGGNVNSAAQAQTFKANAPDLGAAMSADKANEIAKQNADTNEVVGTADAIKKLKEAGVVDRNTAAKEVEAQAKLWEAQTNERHINAIINRINQMLPGELEGQALDLVLKAQNGKLNQSEMKYLDSIGLTKTQMIAIGGKVADMLNNDIFQLLDMKNDRNISAERNSSFERAMKPRDHTIDNYNINGEITGGKYIHYR